MSSKKKRTTETVETVKSAPKPKLKKVKSGEQCVLNGEQHQYLDIQTRTSRGKSLTRAYFRRMSDNHMIVFSPDDPALLGFDFIRP